MRTTVALDADLAAKLRAIAKERGVTFKEALNAALRAGLAPQRGGRRPYRVRSHSLGLRAGVDLTKATQLAAAMEDEETLRKLGLRK